jgi:hypothetical protein
MQRAAASPTPLPEMPGASAVYGGKSEGFRLRAPQLLIMPSTMMPI